MERRAENAALPDASMLRAAQVAIDTAVADQLCRLGVPDTDPRSIPAAAMERLISIRRHCPTAIDGLTKATEE